ncbi:hypothetical protein D9M68_679950 [compost metagenome]
MQGVATAQSARLGQFLLGQQPTDLDLRHRARIAGQHIQPQSARCRLQETNDDFPASEEILALAQAEYAIDQLALLWRKGLAIQLAVQFDRQLGRRLDIGLEPLQAEDGLQTL